MTPIMPIFLALRSMMIDFFFCQEGFRMKWFRKKEILEFRLTFRESSRAFSYET
jgi:hypothetical protein